MSQWIYLTDMAPQATILNPETNELRRIMSSAVKERAPAGLRRHVLEELPGGIYRETGDVVAINDDLLDEMEEAYAAPNSWNYDWPHWATESLPDEDPAMRERIVSRLTEMMSAHPYDFQITGLQRRYLMYFSDGNYNSQQRFDRLIPTPDGYPFRRSGDLRRKYDWIWNSNMRDAKVPFPDDKRGMYGDLRPCLYLGPAWVVRFQLDGQDVLLERCRVYVNDDAEFICSDWCQRHDFSSYGNGINLQTGLYTFDGWVVGPCLTKNMESGKFQPKSVVYKRTAVRDLMKKAPVAVPKYEDVFAKAKAAVDKYAKHTLAPEPKAVEVGPITADVLAEALMEAERIFAKQAEDAKRPMYRIPQPDHATNGHIAEFVIDDAARPNHVRVRRHYYGSDFKTMDVSQFRDGPIGLKSTDELFIIDDAAETGFWYGSETGEYLTKGWWLSTVAQYYKDHVYRAAPAPELVTAQEG
jgi:hypothetical protein